MSDQDSGAENLVPAIVNLVETGPVELGAYTVAELTVVDAIVDFLAERPSDEVLVEAVRSLAARKLLKSGDTPEQVEVRGDLGITTAFQRRARTVLDARATGTGPGEPWRILLLPQPEPITMLIRIDALGVHEVSLRKQENALKLLAGWLPHGKDKDHEEGPDDVLPHAERSALVTVTRYTTEGSKEIAGHSTDLVLARKDGQLHAFSREHQEDGQEARLQPKDIAGQDLTEVLARQLAECAG